MDYSLLGEMLRNFQLGDGLLILALAGITTIAITRNTKHMALTILPILVGYRLLGFEMPFWALALATIVHAVTLFDFNKVGTGITSIVDSISRSVEYTDYGMRRAAAKLSRTEKKEMFIDDSLKELRLDKELRKGIFETQKQKRLQPLDIMKQRLGLETDLLKDKRNQELLIQQGISKSELKRIMSKRISDKRKGELVADRLKKINQLSNMRQIAGKARNDLSILDKEVYRYKPLEDRFDVQKYITKKDNEAALRDLFKKRGFKANLLKDTFNTQKYITKKNNEAALKSMFRETKKKYREVDMKAFERAIRRIYNPKYKKISTKFDEDIKRLRYLKGLK